MDVLPSEVELLVVGAGPAGVTCALQAVRAGLDTLLVGDEPTGGLLPAARRIDNLPGFPAGITGSRLATLLREQLKRNRVRTVRARVQHLRRVEHLFRAEFEGRELPARAVVLATGTSPAPFTLPGLERLAASWWLHRDARTLPDDLTDERALVIGGGDAALDTALTLHDRGAAVTIALRSDYPRANAALRAEIEATDVEQLTRHRLLRCVAQEQGKVTTLRPRTGSDRDLVVDHLVLCVGRAPRAELLQDLQATVTGRIRADLPGLFLAGDLIRGDQRFVATAQGDGQRAAQLAIAYLAAQR